MSKRGPTAKGFIPSREKYTCPVKDCKIEIRGDGISKHFSKYANLIALDKANEDLSNLRKNAKTSAKDSVELSEEYLNSLLSNSSENEKLHTFYLVQHAHSSLKLRSYNSINFKCQQNKNVRPNIFQISGTSREESQHKKPKLQLEGIS